MRALAVLVAAAVSVTSVEAQIVFGLVVERESGSPLEGAMVLLFDGAARQVDRSLTDASGRFTLRADTAGTHVLRVDRIGYASVSTGTFRVGPEGLFRRIEVPLAPIELEGLSVSGAPRCAIRPARCRALGLSLATVVNEPG